MGFLDKLVSVALPAAIGFATGGPAGAFAGAVSASEAEKAGRKQKRLIEQAQAEQRRINAMEFDIRGTGLRQGVDYYGMPQKQSQAGFGSSFGSFLSDVGSNIVSPISNLFSQVRPFISQQSVGQPALPTRSHLGGQESQSSGVTAGFVGGFGNLAGQAARFLRTPAGQVGTGLAG